MEGLGKTLQVAGKLWLDSTRSSVVEALSQSGIDSGSGGSAGKKHKNGSGLQTPPQYPDNPFSAAQGAWMSNALSQSLNTFGQHVDMRFQEAETRLSAAETHQDEADVRIAAMEAAYRALSDRMAEATTVIATLQRAPPVDISALQSQMQAAEVTLTQMQANRDTATAEGEGALFILGNIGWDASPVELEAGAAEVWTAAGVDLGSVRQTTSTRRQGGSTCDVLFSNKAAGIAAKMQIKRSALIRNGKTVWMDFKKTREQLKPSRMTHRCHESVNRWLQEKFKNTQAGPSATVLLTATKDLVGKSISIGAHRIGYATNRQWVWLPQAREYLAQEWLAQAKDYCEMD